MEKNNPYRIALNDLIRSINKVVPLEMENRVLLLMKLNTEQKAVRFKDWVKSRMDSETLNATEAEIMHEACVISRE